MIRRYAKLLPADKASQVAGLTCQIIVSIAEFPLTDM